MKTLKYLSFLLLLAGLSSCEDYFGEKTDLDFIDVPEFSNRQIAYVPIQPALTNFDRPVDITIGFDEILYIVDQGSEEVVAMDQAGRELGRVQVPGARAVVQDRRFDLLVIGSTDTAISIGGTVDTFSFSAIYRLRMSGPNGYGIENARVVNKIVHPFYQKPTFSSSDRNITFNRIAIIGSNTDPERNNQYYVTRSAAVGPDQIPSPSSGDAVLWFDSHDDLVTEVPVNTSSGLFSDYFEVPFGITSLTQPPQISARESGDFIFTSVAPDAPLKVQYIEFIEEEFAAEFRPRILASGDTSKAEGFINSPNKFKQPFGLTLAGDASQYIFVTDAGTDSVYQFTFKGFEGVLPPPATGITKFQVASFGGTGSGLTEFRNPMGVAYFDEILYVADAGNGRVLRFKLTTDFD